MGKRKNRRKRRRRSNGLNFNLWDCDCNENTTYADRSTPEFFTDPLKAAKRFCSYCMFGWPLYAGVHLNGKHIAGVNVDGTYYGVKGKPYIPIKRKKQK